MKMGFNYSKLRGKIKEVFGTQERFAQAIGLSEASVSAKLTGKIQFTQCEIFAICELCKIELGEIADYFFTQKVKQA